MCEKSILESQRMILQGQQTLSRSLEDVKLARDPSASPGHHTSIMSRVDELAKDLSAFSGNSMSSKPGRPHGPASAPRESEEEQLLPGRGGCSSPSTIQLAASPAPTSRQATPRRPQPQPPQEQALQEGTDAARPSLKQTAAAEQGEAGLRLPAHITWPRSPGAKAVGEPTATEAAALAAPAATRTRGLPVVGLAGPPADRGDVKARVTSVIHWVKHQRWMALPFDRLVLELDKVGVELSIAEQDLLRLHLQHNTMPK